MKKSILNATIAICILMACFGNASAQSDKPFQDGPVWTIQYIRTKPGMGLTYLKDLAAHWVKLSEAAKQRGIIMDYKVLSGYPGNAGDWDLMLLTEVKNNAALDGMDDKLNAMAKDLFGSESTQHQQAMSRNDMREILGGKLAQELEFK